MNDFIAGSDKEAAEKLLFDLFGHLALFCKHYRITTRRAQSILCEAQVKKLHDLGNRQVETIAATGFSRKTIQKINQKGSEPDDTDNITTILGYWVSDSEFPDALPIRGIEHPTFQDLVEKYGGDLTAKFVMDKLIERGQAILEDDKLHRIKSVNIPSDQANLIPIAARSLNDLLSTLFFNLNSTQEKRSQRRLYSTRIPESQVIHAKGDINQAIQEFRDNVHEIFKKHEIETGDNYQTLGVGLYYFEDDQEDE